MERVYKGQFFYKIPIFVKYAVKKQIKKIFHIFL